MSTGLLIVLCTVVATLVAQRIVQNLLFAAMRRWYRRVVWRAVRRAHGAAVPIPSGLERMIFSSIAEEHAFAMLTTCPLDKATPEIVFRNWLVLRLAYDRKIGRHGVDLRDPPDEPPDEPPDAPEGRA